MKRFGFFILLLSIISCDSPDVKVAVSDDEYFPLRVGYYQIYDVEQTVYELGVPQNSSYQLRSMITDSLENQDGSFTYIIHRTTRGPSDDEWVPKDTWSARVAGKDLIVSQSSIPYVVFNMPVAEGKTWNGNTYNNKINPSTNSPEDLYMMVDARKPCTVGDLSFNDCVTIEQEDNEEFIVYYDKRIEVYARGVGLVSKETIQLNYCNDEDRNCVGQQIVDSGIEYKQTIVAHGME